MTATPETIQRLDVTFKIARFIPETDEAPHYEEYSLQALPTDRVLTVLQRIKDEIDGTLTFRRSCAHGICGSDAMRINGRNRLACKTLIKDLNIKKPVIVEAIKGLPLEKDLVVDMEPFFNAYRDVMPFLIPAGHEPAKERLQSAEDRAIFDDTTKCILCACLHDQLPGLLERRPVLRSTGHRGCPPVHLRLPRRRGGCAPGHPQQQGRRVALPDHLQLHGCVPAWDRGHESDSGSQARVDVPPQLIVSGDSWFGPLAGHPALQACRRHS